MLLSAAAGLYGALAVVPSLLTAVALARLVMGRDRLNDYGDQVAANLPDALGASEWAHRLVDAALSLGPLGVLFAVLASSAYGDGLSRVLRRLAPESRVEVKPPWRNRLMALPLFGLLPLVLAAALLSAPAFGDLVRGNGPVGVALAGYLSLNVLWVAGWLPLTWLFRVVAPGRPRWRSAFAGAVATSAFVSGFLQGFLVFLALPVDLTRPFGGLGVVGMVSALLLWGWVLHAVVCAGYAFTWAWEERYWSRSSSSGS